MGALAGARTESTAGSPPMGRSLAEERTWPLVARSADSGVGAASVDALGRRDAARKGRSSRPAKRRGRGVAAHPVAHSAYARAPAPDTTPPARPGRAGIGG